MYKYTIAFIRRGDEILLLNREKNSWMGRWNGVGGKIERNESPKEAILREIHEETGLNFKEAICKGVVTWEVNGNDAGGMYVYLIEVPTNFIFHTPIKFDEGILDWKHIDWIFHPKNIGIANLNYYLPIILSDSNKYNFRFYYEDGEVIDFKTFPLEKENLILI